MPKYVAAGLEDPHAVRRALQGLDEAIPAGPATAFRALWDPSDLRRPAIRGFRTAFGTKLLSFLGEARGVPAGTDVPLIYDLMVCRTLAAAGARWPASIETEGPPTFDPPHGCVRFATYAAWCRVAALVAEEVGCTPHNVEYSFFLLGRELGPRVRLPRSGCGARPDAEAPDGDDIIDHPAPNEYVGLTLAEATALLDRVGATTPRSA